MAAQRQPERLADDLADRLNSLSLVLSSLAEDAAESGLPGTFRALREARRALVEEAARRHGITL